jgi:hypothetical protein
MSDESQTPTHYALLIGISSYPNTDGAEWRPLKGCVYDVQEIRKHLTKSLRHVAVQMLATDQAEAVSKQQAGNGTELPTHANVIKSLESIVANSSHGDFVYIHFSGHGTAIRPESAFSNDSTGELALVVLEGDNGNGIRYLRGVELAFQLKQMVNKGLKVTVVLDCCASGSVMRDRLDPSVRYLPYITAVDAAFPPIPDKSLSATDDTIASDSRHASMCENWLVNPRGYTVLTACGPTEVARELNAQGRWHGALSYFLIRTFTRHGRVGGWQQLIYSHLRARFRESGSRQHPMLYGNKSLYFFEDARCAADAPYSVVASCGGGLQLEAGEAHGVCERDTFVLSEIDSFEKTSISGPDSILLEVTRVGPLMSDLKQVNSNPGTICSGSMATAVTRLSMRRFPIQLDLQLSNKNIWLTAIQQRQSLNISTNGDIDTDKEFSFFLIASESNGFEVKDCFYQTIVGLPGCPYDLEENADFVLDVTEHLIRYTMVKSLINASTSTPGFSHLEGISIELAHQNGTIFLPGCQKDGILAAPCSHTGCFVHLTEGERFELRVRNNKADNGVNLYIHIYGMSSLWDITSLLRGDYDVLPPKGSNLSKDFKKGTSGEWKKKIKMEIPNTCREPYCDEIIKGFITTEPTSFLPLELPEIGGNIGKHEKKTEIGRGTVLESGDWLAFHFCVRTHRSAVQLPTNG